MGEKLIIELLNKFLKSIDIEYYEFLDLTTKYWYDKFLEKGKDKINKDCSNENKEKYELLHEAMAYTELNCRRNIKIDSDIKQYKDIWGKLDKLDEIRRKESEKQRKEFEEHPSILSTRGHLKILSHEYSEASIYFEKSLKILKTSPIWNNYTRQEILNLFDLTYTYMSLKRE